MFRFLSLLLLLVVSHSALAAGYVRKAGEGLVYFNGITEKVSPESGSERSILAEQVFEKGASTGLHIHDQGDEIFFVVRGTGIAHLDGKDHPISPGDVVFVPRGAIHEMSNPYSSDTLAVVFFMDSPELFHEFRAIKKRLENPAPISEKDKEYFRSFGGSREAQR